MATIDEPRHGTWIGSELETSSFSGGLTSVGHLIPFSYNDKGEHVIVK